MKKLVMILAVLSLLLLASCGPGKAVAQQTTKVQVAVRPAFPEVVVNICDATYREPFCIQKTNTGGIATFTNVPVGARTLTADVLGVPVKKYVTITAVQAPSAFIIPLNIKNVLPDWDKDGWYDIVVLGKKDNCIAIPNPDQTDSNGDGIGDACMVSMFYNSTCQSLISGGAVAFGYCDQCIRTPGVPCLSEGAICVGGEGFKWGNLTEYKLYRDAVNGTLTVQGGEDWTCKADYSPFGGATSTIDLFYNYCANSCYCDYQMNLPASMLKAGKYTLRCATAGSGDHEYNGFTVKSFVFNFV